MRVKFTPLAMLRLTHFFGSNSDSPPLKKKHVKWDKILPKTCFFQIKIVSLVSYDPNLRN